MSRTSSIDQMDNSRRNSQSITRDFFTERRRQTDFHALFYPTNIAVIGVSHNQVSGLKYVNAHEDSRFAGGIYPINPKYTEIDGRTIYPSLQAEEVPEIDLAIIAVPAPIVPSIVQECHQKGVKFGVIFSSGFAESDRPELDNALRDAIFSGPTRFLGPNCLGVYNQESRVSFFPALDYSLPGNISFVSQSGGTTARMLFSVQGLGLGMHNVVSIGNSIDISMEELLRYFKDDPKTQVIALYVENVSNGRAFLDALRDTTRVKPVVIWKGGQSDVGQLAAKSHTGGLAGSYAIWSTALHQHGAILADNFDEMRDFTVALALQQPLPQGERVAIIASGGGLGVELADGLRQLGLEVPELTPETQAKIGEFIPDINSSFRNPVDLGEYGYVPLYFGRALRIITEDPNVDAVLAVREAERFPKFEEMLGLSDFENQNLLAMQVARQVGKPLFMNLSPNSDLPEYYALRYNFRTRLMQEVGIPSMDYTPIVAKLIKQLASYRRYLENI